MKYWEIIADRLSAAGWSWGCVSAIDREGRTIWIADAHRDDGKRFVVRADEKLTGFLELDSAIRHGKDCPSFLPFRGIPRTGHRIESVYALSLNVSSFQIAKARPARVKRAAIPYRFMNAIPRLRPRAPKKLCSYTGPSP